MGRSEEKKNDCPQCDEVFESHTQLEEHMQEEHPAEDGKRIECPSPDPEQKQQPRFHYKEGINDEHVDLYHVTKEAIKREQSSEEEEDNSADSGSRTDVNDNEAAEMAEKDGSDMGLEQGMGRSSSRGSLASESDSIVNVESEIKVDNDSYAIVFYWK